jgi:glycine dehydrogenase subunit 1
MSYIPNTDDDIVRMLETIDVRTIEDLFSHIPEKLRFKSELDLPSPLSEMELVDRMQRISSLNATLQNHSSFIGGGVYHHHLPSVVSHLAGRAEFYTSYTPYQPEISQGTLQAIFEYQTLMCMLTAMDVSNASMYDGASSAAEAVLMSFRTNRRGRVALSSSLHPQYRRVIETYASSNDRQTFLIPYDKNGCTDLPALQSTIDESVSCVVVQSPNYFGIIEDMNAIERIIHSQGALFIAVFTEPIAFGILKPPGNFGADIVCGEGQSLGITPGFGGPFLGILTCRKELLRTMPGRIVGKTLDIRGNPAYVLTLTAREQHIRREKSTSNICTNQGLCALAATLYLACYGKKGFRRLSALNHWRAEYAKTTLSKVEGVALRFSSPTFNEFVLRCKRDPEEIAEKLLEEKLLFGIALGRDYPELSDCTLLTCTEMNSEDEIDNLARLLKEIR